LKDENICPKITAIDILPTLKSNATIKDYWTIIPTVVYSILGARAACSKIKVKNA
jgi:hypothetical protein